MPVTIYMVRHAEAHNPRGILYGRIPRVDLSTKGREQAGALAQALAELTIAAVYHSPLLRARRTAARIASQHPGVPLRETRLLLENRHPFEGRPHAEVARLGDRAYDADILGSTGETISDLRDRLVRFMHQVRERHSGAAVVAVAHADPLAALRAHLLGLELTSASLRKEAPPLASSFRIDLMDDGSAQLEWVWKPPSEPVGDKEKVESLRNGEGAHEGATAGAVYAHAR